MKLHLHTFELELNHTFKISRDIYNSRKILVIELEKNGIRGFGEACEHGYYEVSVSAMLAIFQKLNPVIESYDFDTPEQFWEFMNPYLAKHPFAQCALDVAAHDFFGKKIGKPLYEIWGLNLENLPVTDYTIGIDSIDKMVSKMKEFPWSVYKIKLGTDQDLEIVKTLRHSTNAPFRIDANCGWTAEETIRKSFPLKKLGVEFIEQPLPFDDFDGMKMVFKKSALPLFADESCRREEDVIKCVGTFHGINIKLMKCGGLTPAKRMIAQARALGLQVMAGCMIESSIGISALAHLLPLLDFVDMDSIFLIKNDIAEGIKIKKDGSIVFPKRNGVGCILKSDKFDSD